MSATRTRAASLAVLAGGLIVTSATAAELFTVESTKLHGTGTGGEFGTAVAIEGDRLAVGALHDSGATSDTGTVRTFVRTGDTWTLEALLFDVDGQPGDAFGSRLALDGETLAVGAPGNGHAGSQSGAVHVYELEGGVWVHQARLVADDAMAQRAFGQSVGLDGDTLVIGSHFAPPGGAAYVFVRAGTTWTQQARLSASDAASNDQFGVSVAVDGDSVICGSRYAANPGSGSGAAYVFVREGATWTEMAKLSPTAGLPASEFGRIVALQGGTAVIAALGKAYAFSGAGAQWTEQDLMLPSGGESSFAHGLALDGDTLLLGAWKAGDLGSDAGAAYVYTRDGSDWSEQVRLLASDGAQGDNFGLGVGLHGKQLAVCARYDDDLGDDSGSVYVLGLHGTLQYGLDVGGANIASLDCATVPGAATLLRLDVSGLDGMGPALLAISPARAWQPLAGGTLLVDLSSFWIAEFSDMLDGTGWSEFRLPGLVGLTGCAQAFRANPTLPGGLAFSNGLEVTTAP